eukprot:m.24526 g.24526  ORF g.24526 m.24526 type:complete len:93 (+) comp6085_c0_seq2:137-415(+)
MDEMEIDGAGGAAAATTSTMTSSVASGSDYTLYGNVMSMITALTHRARAVSDVDSADTGARRDESKRRVHDHDEEDDLEDERVHKVSAVSRD